MNRQPAQRSHAQRHLNAVRAAARRRMRAPPGAPAVEHTFTSALISAPPPCGMVVFESAEGFTFTWKVRGGRLRACQGEVG